MVPHCRLLQACSLLAVVLPDGDAVAAAAAQDVYCAFPAGVTPTAFVQQWVTTAIPPVYDSVLRTSDVRTDMRAFFAVANLLGVGDIVAITANGPAIVVPEAVAEIRRHKTLRIFVETYQLANLGTEILAADLKLIFGRTFDEHALARHKELFVDTVWLSQPSGWQHYESCVGVDEAKFKRDLIVQPSDYLRWKLGVPVTLNQDVVLDRLISDAYYTERLLKSQHAELDKDQLARIKLERDTIFKAMDRKLKAKEAAHASGAGSGMNAAVEAIRSLTIGYSEQTFTHMDDLK